MHLVAEVRGLPGTLEQRKISDHAPVAAILRARPPPDPDDQPIPRRVFEHPDFQRYVDEFWPSLDLSELSPLILELYKKVLREGARYARNALLSNDPHNIASKLILLRSILG
eukprot:2981227-Pyramimonas_sp.AAC.1